MKGTRAKRSPEFIVREGKPTGVILDINEYEEMLEKLHDVEDLNILKKMRTRPLKFKKLKDFLKEYHPSV